ncbi:enoyl-CoA hydratase/isomerase family protein [Aegicerativicinus sediminis]
MNKTEPYVTLTIENAVGFIEFFHPAHNSLPSDLLAELAKTISDADVNDDIKIIVLKSGGDRTFCAGASFNELISINDEEIGKKFFSGFANVINAMRKCSKLIIGRIQGKTVGGGVGLAAATDYCFATKYAAIKLSELNVGIGPFVVGPAIERKIGVSALSQIAIDANTFYEPKWAQSKGLFMQVYDSADEMDGAILSLAENLCAYNPEAMKEIKNMLWKGTENWDELLAERAAISGRLVLSEFTKETLKRFK